jgi:hypothetical protein
MTALENPSQADAEWINTWDGLRERAGSIQAGITRLRKPESFGKAPALLVVRSAR